MKKMTYGNLESVLLSLGFDKRPIEPNGVLYFVPNDKNIWIPMPVRSSNDPIRPHHYVAARLTIDGLGPVDAAVFEREMKAHGELPDGVMPYFPSVK